MIDLQETVKRIDELVDKIEVRDPALSCWDKVKVWTYVSLGVGVFSFLFAVACMVIHHKAM